MLHTTIFQIQTSQFLTHIFMFFVRCWSDRFVFENASFEGAQARSAMNRLYDELRAFKIDSACIQRRNRLGMNAVLWNFAMLANVPSHHHGLKFAHILAWPSEGSLTQDQINERHLTHAISGGLGTQGSQDFWLYAVKTMYDNP